MIKKLKIIFCCYYIGDPKRKRLQVPVRSPDAKALETVHRKMVDTKKQREDFRKALVDIVT
jgi:hypothetical protein